MEQFKILTTTAQTQYLTSDQAIQAVQLMFSGQIPTADIVQLLTTLNTRPTNGSELAGFVNGIIQTANYTIKADDYDKPLIDLAGTGGDQALTINVTTLAAFIAAGTNQVVTSKYGNRAASSKCGSMDVLEALGVIIELSHDQVVSTLKSIGLAPIYARSVYPGAKHVADARSQIGHPTIFNLALPMARPLCGNYCFLMGIADLDSIPLVLEGFKSMGISRALIIRGHDGMDEVSISGNGSTDYWLLHDGQVNQAAICCLDLGFTITDLSLLQVHSIAESASYFEQILNPSLKTSNDQLTTLTAMRDYAVINAAAALFTALDDSTDIKGSLPKYLALAKQTLESGAAYQKLNQLRSGNL
jgi:anthranilate phosphoribosyltransferase